MIVKAKKKKKKPIGLLTIRCNSLMADKLVSSPLHNMLDWEAINREYCYYYNKDDLIFSVLKEILVLIFKIMLFFTIYQCVANLLLETLSLVKNS